MDPLETLKRQVEEAEENLRDIQARIPAHSIRPWQIQELEEAEETVERLKREIAALESGSK